VTDDDATDDRWPRRVYGVGSEPDPRFTFANERTFLAWVRTALGFIAAGVAVAAVATLGAQVGLEFRAAALLLILCGLACGVTAFLRWARNERALRLQQPLPSSPMLALLTLGLVVVAAVSLAAAVLA